MAAHFAASLRQTLQRGGGSVLVLTACLLLAAHALRAGDTGLALCFAGTAGFAFCRAAWKRLAVAAVLACGVLEWLHAAWWLILLRRGLEQPWGRAAVILCAVAAFTAVAAWRAFCQGRRLAGPEGLAPALTQAAVFAGLFAALYAVRRHAPVPMLMLERLAPAVGGVQLFLVAWYAGALTGALLDPARTRKARQWAWRLFCGVFFAQFALGAAGLTAFLLSGRLHAPIPAFIVYGPFYREAPGMMLVVAGLSVLVLGSAWCSHLCYFGPLDALAAQGRPLRPLPRFWRWMRTWGRPLVLAAGALLALLLGRLGMDAAQAAALAVAFGLGSLLIMALASRRLGGMIHCSAFCPMGLVVSLLARLSPWRLAVDADRCDQCGVCERVCAYRAITPASRAQGGSTWRCSLCRDCVGVCHRQAITLRGPWMGPRTAWRVFVGLAAFLHGLFLGVAMV